MATTPQPEFHALMAHFLARLGVTNKQERDPTQDTYTVAFGPLELNFVGNQEDFLNIFCFPGNLIEPSLSTLSLLLFSNCYQAAHPPISVGVIPEQPAKLALWSRIRFSEANDDTLMDLFVRLVETADAARNWLEAGAPGVSDASSPFLTASV